MYNYSGTSSSVNITDTSGIYNNVFTLIMIIIIIQVHHPQLILQIQVVYIIMFLH